MAKDRRRGRTPRPTTAASPQTVMASPIGAVELIALYKAADYAGVIAAASRAHADHQDALFWNVVASAHWSMGNFEAAAAACRRSLSADPANSEVRVNLALALAELGYYADAIEASLAAIVQAPTSAAAHNALGLAFHRNDRVEAAIEAYTNALILDPEASAAHKNLGLLLLQRGNFEDGLDHYEWRNRAADLVAPSFDVPLWTGREDLAGKTLFLYHEQGLGDTIQFIRYAELAVARGARVAVSVQDALVPLFDGAMPGVSILPSQRAPASIDYYSPLLSLPRAFATRVDTIPGSVPYIVADPARIDKWRRRLGSEGFRIGICWQGSDGTVDRGRSVPLAQFAPLARIEGARLISLHKGHGEAQLAALPAGMNVEIPGPDFDADGAFLDSAAIMKTCDLVITSDTAIAHLAGALGVPVWVAVKRYPDWRWLLDRTDSPWYPTMRLYRQQLAGDWTGVFARIEADLRSEVARADKDSAAAIPLAPASWGDMCDRLSILELKLSRIADPAALDNIRREHRFLCRQLIAMPSGADEDRSIRHALASVNRDLWEIEDALREHERRGDFGDQFVTLARSVYHLNDERARLKRTLNVQAGSALFEEKSYAGA